ncbi:hypothetical protein [Curtobacterium sp. NPDC089991]|uniref:hypothetical protein n=1 Tax=Curtobacterium sp. NPDC089991 TaxID=3363969 RepID=UPI0037FFB6D2
MSMKNTVAAAVIVVLGIGALPTAANATTPAPTTLAVLTDLRGTQSHAEIDAVMQGAAPVEALADPDTGDILAAMSVRSRALTPVGPGCTSTSACMLRSSGGPYGLTGTGTKTGTWRGVTGVKSGSRRTSFWASNGMAYEYRAGASVTWTKAVTVTKVSR